VTVARTRSPKPGSAAWAVERRRAIFATDAAPVAGLSRFGDPFSVYLEKLGMAAPKITSEAMEWGLLLQDPIGRAWARRAGVKVKPAGHYTYWRHDLPFPMAAHTDFLTDVGHPVEVKNASHFSAADFGEPDTDEIPVDYRLQLAHELAVLDRPVGHLVVLIGGNRLRHYLVQRDDELERNLLEVEQRAWEGVRHNSPPAIDGSDGASEYLRITQTRDDGTEIEADEELQAMGHRLLAVRAALGELEGEERGLTNIIKSRLGEAARASGGDISIRYKRNRDSLFVDWERVARVVAPDDEELASAISSNSTLKPGARPLVVRYQEV
jgi:putative phage-type endonuclease